MCLYVANIVVIYLVAGYVFDKYRWGTSGAVAFLLICLGQSVSYFSESAFPVFPYAVFSNAGNNTLEVFLVALPAVYCAETGKKGIYPGLGYIAMYGGLAIMGTVFEFVPENLYRAALGVTLLLSIGAVYLVLSLVSDYDKYRYEQLLLKNPEVSDFREKFAFSRRECEVLEYIVSGVVTSDIAARLSISERTVNFHVGRMLKKTGSKNRVELVFRVKN
jgi:DNA-binding CsgD family transcriptional regulator